MICSNTEFCFSFLTFIYGILLLLGSADTQSSRGELRSYEEAAQIYSTISRKYDARIRPPSNHSEPVVVSVDLRLNFVYSFNIQEQTLSSLVSLNLSWSDRRLAWYPNNILKVIVNQNLIWVPNISFFNGLSLPQEIGEGSIHLQSKGNVCWYRQLSVKTFCRTDFNNQTNTCVLSLGSTSYRSSEQKLQLRSFTIGDFLENNHLWQVNANENDTGVYENNGIIRCAVDLSPLQTNYPAYSLLRSSSPSSRATKIIFFCLAGFFFYLEFFC